MPQRLRTLLVALVVNWLVYSVGEDGLDDGGKRVSCSVAGTITRGDLFYDSPYLAPSLSGQPGESVPGPAQSAWKPQVLRAIRRPAWAIVIP
jgi:hypothetical protein